MGATIPIVIENTKLLNVMAMCDRENNTIWLLVAVHEALSGDCCRLKQLTLLAPTPHEPDKGIEQYELDPSPEDINHWLSYYRGKQGDGGCPLPKSPGQ
jgi:hypothetical protein